MPNKRRLRLSLNRDEALRASRVKIGRGTLEHELVDELDGKPAALVRDYLEDFYNAERRHSKLGRVSPVAFEQAFRAKRGNRGPGASLPEPPDQV